VGVHVISGFCHGVNEVFALLGSYTAYIDAALPLIQHNLTVRASSVKQPYKFLDRCTKHSSYQVKYVQQILKGIVSSFYCAQ
jgi:hypothetical protein